MAHPRQDILDAVAAALVEQDDDDNYPTAAGARVTVDLFIPHKKTELPAIAIYHPTETGKESGTAPREIARRFDLQIEAAVKVGDNVLSTLNALCLQIERVMQRDETFGGKAGDCLYSGTEFEVGNVGEQLAGVARITYDVTYMTNVPFPEDVETNEFESAGITYQLEGTQAIEDPEDPDDDDDLARDELDLEEDP